jgi:hypothetical protein
MEIIRYFRSGKKLVDCPICRNSILEKDLKPNINLKSIIENWKVREHDELINKLFDSTSIYFYDSNNKELKTSELLERKKKLECQMLNFELQQQHLKIEYKKIVDILQLKKIEDETF